MNNFFLAMEFADKLPMLFAYLAASVAAVAFVIITTRIVLLTVSILRDKKQDEISVEEIWKNER